MAGSIDQLIVNAPYEEPERHWRYDRESRTFSLEAGRRPAGYVVATPGSKSFDDPGLFVELPLVNRIRPRVQGWREAGYPGVTGTTLRLLQHWRDPEGWDERRFFFCQLEAIETLIWLTEAPAGERQGIDVPGDGGPSRGSAPRWPPAPARPWSWPWLSRGMSSTGWRILRMPASRSTCS